jgi:hypothetical protein
MGKDARKNIITAVILFALDIIYETNVTWLAVRGASVFKNNEQTEKTVKEVTNRILSFLFLIISI